MEQNQPFDSPSTDQEMIESLKRLNGQMNASIRELIRIRNNVVFFFWLTMISLFGWVFVLIIFGSIGAMM